MIVGDFTTLDELRKDKARLDWLQANVHEIEIRMHTTDALHYYRDVFMLDECNILRDSIDAAMKAKP